MKKRNILVAVLLLAVLPGFAQLRTGIKGGANLSQIDMNINGIELDAYRSRAGVHAGFMAESMFNPNMGLHGELIYFNSGADINPGQFKYWFDVAEDVSVTGHLNMHTIQLPLYMKAKVSISPQIKLYVMGGGFATYALKAEMFERLSLPGENPLKLKWSLYDHKVRIFDQDETNIHLQHRWNAGLAAEAGMETANGITFGIGLRRVLSNMAAYGLTSGNASIKPVTHMWTASVSVGYMF